MNKLIPIGDLRSLSWFWLPGNGICLVLYRAGGIVDYVYRDGDEYFQIDAKPVDCEVEPLPDCTSFSWKPPKPPTALELAKALRDAMKAPCELKYLGICDRINEIVSVMEREANK